MNRFNSTNSRTAYSARRLLRHRSIFSALVTAVENKPRGWTALKTSLLLQSILDFVETHVCSLVYKFAFSTDCLSRLHFAPCQGDMAMSVRACLDLLPGLDSCGQELLLLAGCGKDGQPYTVVPKVPQVTLEETIGDSALRANASIISRTNSASSISPSTTKVYKSTLLLCSKVSSSKSAVPPHNLVRTELHAYDNCRHRRSPGDV